MGFESKVSGFISVKIGGSSIEEKISEIENCLETLPKLREDNFPFLPREIFGISKLNKGENNVPIAYRSIMIHFGISMKQLDEEIEVWINKYEQFLKRIPNAWESIVNIEIIPFTANYPMNHLRYHWFKEFKPKSEESYWRFEGDPTNWEELTNDNFMPKDQQIE